MADMHKFQLLINCYHKISPDEAQEVLKIASEAGDTLALGLAAVGELMFHASDSEGYDPQSMRSSMFNIGLLMRCLGNFQMAIRTAEENAEYALQQADKGGAQ